MIKDKTRMYTFIFFIFFRQKYIFFCVRLPDIKSVARIDFLSGVMRIVLQSGNQTHALALHCRSGADDDLKTQTHKLECSDLNEVIIL